MAEIRAEFPIAIPGFELLKAGNGFDVKSLVERYREFLLDFAALLIPHHDQLDEAGAPIHDQDLVIPARHPHLNAVERDRVSNCDALRSRGSCYADMLVESCVEGVELHRILVKLEEEGAIFQADDFTVASVRNRVTLHHICELELDAGIYRECSWA